MPIKVVFRRHAHRSLAPGAANIHSLLTPEGIKASKKVGKRLKKKSVEPKIYHSTVERTKQTAHAIKEKSGSRYQLRVRPSINRFRKEGASQQEIDHLFRSRPELEVIHDWLQGKHRHLFITPYDLAQGVVKDLKLAVRAEKKYPQHTTRLDVVGHDTTLLALFETLTGQKIRSKTTKPESTRDYVDFLEPLTIVINAKKIVLSFRKKNYDVTKNFFELLKK